MNKSLFIIIFYLPLFYCHQVSGQEQLNNMDDIYGLNPELYNGKVYSDFYGSSVKGHQFLWSPEYSKGDLIINNKSYHEQIINYDIFKQKLLLSFTNYTKTQRIIEIPLKNIQSFSFSDMYFQLMSMPDSSIKIFQVIGKSKFPILIYWKKNMITTTSTSIYDYKFTEPKRDIWLVKDHQFYPITKNKSLLKLFDKEQAIVLKKWLKSQNIRIQKAKDWQLQKLSEYLYAL